MAKTKLHENAVAITESDQATATSFKENDRVTIKSNHPLFPGATCTITALPSPDAAIVELSNGSREHLLLKYLLPLPNIEQAAVEGVEKLDSSSVEISENNSIAPPFGARSDTNDIQELTLDEERERHRLELKVERAFYVISSTKSTTVIRK